MGKSCLFAAALLGLASSGPAHAWGNDGHEVVALIARSIIEQQNPLVASRIDALLAGPTDPQAGSSFEAKARWADAYRESSSQRREATRRWHFIDLEVSGPDRDQACFGNPPLASGTPASQGPAKDCVVRKINQFRRELRDPSVSKAEKKLALLFLLHFVGDIHQPLHSADNHDSGGNSVFVVIGNAKKGTNLHSYWDSIVVSRLGSTPKAIAAALVADLPPSSEMVGVPSDERTYAWADEAYEVARRSAYQALPAKTRACTIQPRDKPPRTKSCAVISTQYAIDATGKARLQLQRAGARLAAVLIEALE